MLVGLTGCNGRCMLLRRLQPHDALLERHILYHHAMPGKAIVCKVGWAAGQHLGMGVFRARSLR